MTDPSHPDVWELLERSVTATEASDTTTAGHDEAPDDEEQDDPRKLRRQRLLLDAVASAFWVYALCAVFIADPLRLLLEEIAPRSEWLANYRTALFLLIAALLGVFKWTWFSLLLALYILAFPLIILFWKVPRFFLHRKSWTLLMVGLNAIGLLIRNLRYNLVTKSLGLLFIGGVLLSDREPVLWFSGLGLFAIFSWATFRTIRRTFEPNWFLRYQTSAIDRIVESSLFKTLTTQELQKVLDRPRESLTSVEVTSVSNGISFSVLANRALYFWAYRLREYKQARLAVVFNLAAYAWLFFGAATSFALANIALFKIDPNAYSYQDDPSTLAMAVYGVSTLALNDGAGIASATSIAHILRLGAGLFGVVFLAVLATDLFVTWRRERDEAALNETVEALKIRARRQETQLKDLVDVGVDEARDRLQKMGLGIAGWVAYLTASLPDDFLD